MCERYFRRGAATVVVCRCDYLSRPRKTCCLNTSANSTVADKAAIASRRPTASRAPAASRPMVAEAEIFRSARRGGEAGRRCSQCKPTDRALCGRVSLAACAIAAALCCCRRRAWIRSSQSAPNRSARKNSACRRASFRIDGGSASGLGISAPCNITGTTRFLCSSASWISATT